MADDPTPESETPASPPDPTAETTAPAADATSDPVADMGAATASLENVEADLASAQASIDELLKQANFEDPSTMAPQEVAMPTQAFDLPNFADAMHEQPS